MHSIYISDLQTAIRLALRLCRSEPGRDSNDDREQRASTLRRLYCKMYRPIVWGFRGIIYQHFFSRSNSYLYHEQMRVADWSTSETGQSPERLLRLFHPLMIDS